MRRRAGRLVELGILERVGRKQVLVARKYYKMIGKPGTFTRLKGLDAETNKELLKRHMRDMGNPGIKLSGFQEVLPALDVRQIQWLLQEMRKAGEVCPRGRTNASRWYLSVENAN